LRSPAGEEEASEAGIFSNSIEGAREGAAAQDLDRARALFGKVGERLHEVLVELLAGAAARPQPESMGMR
jgi:hypothetical protein